jgi:predicted ribosome-associated RNA-binding protein Tma20
VSDTITAIIRAPIGVGHMLVSSDAVERSGMQGKGVEMLHLFQDKLWYGWQAVLCTTVGV